MRRHWGLSACALLHLVHADPDFNVISGRCSEALKEWWFQPQLLAALTDFKKSNLKCLSQGPSSGEDYVVACGCHRDMLEHVCVESGGFLGVMEAWTQSESKREMLYMIDCEPADCTAKEINDLMITDTDFIHRFCSAEGSGSTTCKLSFNNYPSVTMKQNKVHWTGCLKDMFGPDSDLLNQTARVTAAPRSASAKSLKAPTHHEVGTYKVKKWTPAPFALPVRQADGMDPSKVQEVVEQREAGFMGLLTSNFLANVGYGLMSGMGMLAVICFVGGASIYIWINAPKWFLRMKGVRHNGKDRLNGKNGV